MRDVFDLLETLNPEQKTAVMHPSGPAMVLAGAGSGKTTVLTTRVAWLLAEQKIKPEAMMVVTFTNKAAAEIRHRILAQTGQTLSLSGTFHSLCARILRRNGAQIGMIPDYIIYDTDDQESLLKEIYKSYSIDPKEYPIKMVLSVISGAKNQMLSPIEFANKAQGSRQTETARIYKLYQHALKTAQAVDFDDLLLRTLELFAEHPTTLQRYQQLLEHVLVDEYQDTNTVQYTLTKLLAAPQNNLYVVGDFSQSIYSWRGADYRNMMALKTDFPQMAEYRLERNYRSKQNILDAATSIISQNTSHPILELWTEQEGGEQIIAYEAESASDEAAQVSKYIRQLRGEYRYDDMVILYRTNAQSRAFEEAFMRSSIPYRLVGGTKFYERKEVKDVLSYVRYLVNRADVVSYQRILKLGKRSFATFAAWIDSESGKQALAEPPALLLRTILEQSNYLEKYSKQSEENLQRIANVYELVNVAAQFETLTQFLENVALIQNDTFSDVESDEQNKNAVTLMSIHAAKGLEFSVVFVVGMEEGLFPHSRSFLDKDEMEEERRLCYVAITRAKERLFLTHARSRYQYGVSTNSMQSRFVADVPEDLIQHEPSGLSKWQSSSSSSQSKSSSGRKYVPIDEDMLDGVLNGEFDMDSFINS